MCWVTEEEPGKVVAHCYKCGFPTSDRNIRKAVGLPVYEEWPARETLTNAQMRASSVEKWVYHTKAGKSALHTILRHDLSCSRPDCNERGPHKHSFIKRETAETGTPLEPGYLVHLHKPDNGAASPEPTVVVCEGQKTAQSISAIGHIGVSYIQGSGYAGKADYSPLAGMQLILVAPDNDDAGQKAALESARELLLVGVQEVVILDKNQFPRGGGDLADLTEADRMLAILAPEGESYTNPEKAAAHLAIHQFNVKSANLPGSKLDLMDASEAFQLHLQTETVWDGLIKHLVVAPMVKKQSPELYLHQNEIVSLFEKGDKLQIRSMGKARSKGLVSRGMFWHKGFEEKELFSLGVDELTSEDWQSVATVLSAQIPTEHGRITYKPMSRDAFTGKVESPHSWSIKIPKSAYPNPSVSTNVTENPDERLPDLESVIQRPMLSADGDGIIIDSGYHAGEQVYLQWFGEKQIPDLEAGLAVLEDVFGEFPFDTESSRTNFYGCLLAGFVGMACSSKPMFMISKPEHRVGATLLAELVSIILSGDEPINAGPMGSQNDDDNGKRITSAAYKSTGVVLMDNMAGDVNSAELAIYLTSSKYSARKLGSNTDQIEISRKPLVDIATGMNPQLSVELLKRCVTIRIDPKMEDPSKRTFKIEDVSGYVKENREQVVCAVLSMIKHWIDVGAPLIKSENVLGGFEQWRNITNSILVTCGFEGFLENLKESEERMVSEEGSAGKELVRFWLENRGYYGVTANELAEDGAVGSDDNLDMDIVPLGSGKRHGRLIKFGNYMKTMEGKTYEFEDGTKVIVELTGLRPKNKTQYRLAKVIPDDYTDFCTVECGLNMDTDVFEHMGGCPYES